MPWLIAVMGIVDRVANTVTGTAIGEPGGVAIVVEAIAVERVAISVTGVLLVGACH